MTIIQSSKPERTEVAQQIFDTLDSLPFSGRLSAYQLETIYALGYSHVSQQHYDRALPVFTFLAQFGPTHKQYLAGLALCLQMVGRHDEAIRIYSIVVVLYPESLEIMLRLAECQLGASQPEAARVTLSALIDDCRPDVGRPDLLRQAETLVALIDCPFSAAESDAQLA
jgi:type III secretion system low calcium response chaperone LcrH/SycD